MFFKKPTKYNNYFYEDEVWDKGKKKLPVLYNDKSECCGCSACYSICPTKAISMKPDEEGFEYPIVNACKCIRCYKCISTCPIKIAMKENKK